MNNPSNQTVGTSAKAQTLHLSRMSILVVDDNDFVLKLVTSILKGLEVGRIMTATDVLDAQNLVQLSASLAEDGRHPEIDIIISELFLKSGSGVDLLKWVRQHKRDRTRFMPFIMMGGFTEPKHIRYARDNGANEFLAKPFSVNTIASRLISVIDKPRPFVKTDKYFGPDRRRQEMLPPGQERRKSDSGLVEVINERD
tara:strand:- start:57 stop:650 length:594 start_codon:yes stop_codon:yes gene_type:complete